MRDLMERMKAAVRRLYPDERQFEWEWLKDSDHRPHPSDKIIDSWHVWYRRVGTFRQRERERLEWAERSRQFYANPERKAEADPLPF